MTFKSLMNMQWSSLSDRGFIQVSGEVAEKFLQGQLTSDVRLVKQQPTCLTAHCNSKGRIIFTGWLFYEEGNYLLAMPESQVTTAITALQKYAIFSKVTVEDVTPLIKSTLNTLSNPHAWKLKDIEGGIAEIYPETREQFTPHELNYPELNAVSFDKGCYIGQEIIARMHYLGKLKTQLIHAHGTFTNSPRRGEKIFYRENEKEEIAGYIVDFAKEDGDCYHMLISVSAKAIGSELHVANVVLALRN
jgi:tRNA-modifying protein YgfZ